MSYWKSVTLLGVVLITYSSGARAETTSSETAASALNTVVEETKPAYRAAHKKPARGRNPREKHGQSTEGTEAPNRFEADPVIKSRYESNGRALEVDPD